MRRELCGEGGARGDAELGEGLRQVRLDSLLAEEETARDLSVGHASADEFADLAFPAAEGVDSGCAGAASTAVADATTQRAELTGRLVGRTPSAVGPGQGVRSLEVASCLVGV